MSLAADKEGLRVTLPSQDVTALLLAWRQGDEHALESLVPLVYRELRRLAHHQLKNERSGHLLQTTALIHEAYLRLLGASQVPWNDRTHFFAVAARVMRRVLVEEARERAALKRGGGTWVQPLDETMAAASPGVEITALDEALTALEQQDPRRAKVVELRYFGGLSVEEVAEVLQVSSDTVTRDWKRAKLWLLLQLRPETASG